MVSKICLFGHNIPVYANTKTWAAIQTYIKGNFPAPNKNTFNMLESFNLGDLKIFPFPIPHDAADPCGFNIYHGSQKLSIVTDLGHVNPHVFKYLENSSSIILESNYDPNILTVSTYPRMLKQRISGPNGHLANDIAANTICQLIGSGLKDALLVHLSKENNFPELAHQTIIAKLSQNNYAFSEINIDVAPRNHVSNRFTIT